ncbi:MAG TPA: alpha/beta hydrolase [Gemmatimonadaceae bacterium]
MAHGRAADSMLALAVLAASLGTACKPAADAKDDTPAAAAAPELMPPGALEKLPAQPADQHIAYGKDSSQYGDLRIPAGSGPHPVAILVHGGCFKAQYATTRDLAAMADALKEDGIATWNVEYRRVGQPGGGWPGTYLDVANAVDYLRNIAKKYSLDLNRVVIVGHSAGGHLAMWAAARSRVPSTSAIYTKNPTRVRGVIDLAGPLDLSAHITEYEQLCRDSVITSLMGGTPQTVSARYAQASPIKLVPLGIPQVLVIGEHEDFVPRPLVEAYAQAATQAGDSVRTIVIPAVGHFEIASPSSSTWPAVKSAIVALMDGKLPPSTVP